LGENKVAAEPEAGEHTKELKKEGKKHPIY